MNRSKIIKEILQRLENIEQTMFTKQDGVEHYKKNKQRVYDLIHQNDDAKNVKEIPAVALTVKPSFNEKEDHELHLISTGVLNVFY